MDTSFATTSGAVFHLRPRFLPDRDAHTEWGARGSNLVRMIRRGYRVPPTAALGSTQIQNWLESFPEWGPALQAWRDWEDADAALARLRAVILQAPMPEHWGKSTATLLQLLCGEQSWPLILRPSVKKVKGRAPHRVSLGYLKIESPEPELLWRAVLEIVASYFEIEPARQTLLRGFDPKEVRLAIVIQPVLKARESGVWESGKSSVPADAPYSKELTSRGHLADRSFKRPVRLQWIWDGEEIWFVDIQDIQAIGDTPLETRKVSQLLIDLDGTLLAARELSLNMSFVGLFLKEIRRHGGWLKATQALRAVMQEFKKPSLEITNDQRAIRRFAQVMGKPIVDAQDLLRDTITQLFPKLERFFYPVPGARDFLDWARQAGFPMMLATNPVWDEPIIELRLKWAGIPREWFSSVTHSSRMRACKPEAQYYSEILQQEKFVASDCLLVGDDMKNDLPATQVGIRVFILNQKDEFRSLSVPGGTPAWQGSYPRLKALLRALTS